VAIDLMDGGPCLSLEGLEPGQWRELTATEQGRLQRLLQGRGGRDGGGKSGRAGGGA
jgi:23S rRNA pseudouridine2457 synthase